MKLPSVSHSLDFTTFISGWVKTSPLVDVVTLGCSISTALVSCFPAKNLKVKNPAAKERSHFHNQQEVLSPQEIKPSVIFLWGIFFFWSIILPLTRKLCKLTISPNQSIHQERPMPQVWWHVTSLILECNKEGGCNILSLSQIDSGQ